MFFFNALSNSFCSDAKSGTLIAAGMLRILETRIYNRGIFRKTKYKLRLRQFLLYKKNVDQNNEIHSKLSSQCQSTLFNHYFAIMDCNLLR